VTVLRAGDIDRFLSQPDPKKPVVLVYGPDSGLVSERAGIVVRKMSGDDADPFSLVQLDGDIIASDPGKLIDEAQTIGLFGNRRVIRVRAGAKNFASAVETLLAKPPQATVVIEAGDLRPTSPLRSVCEKSQAAAVIPCYVDTERDLAKLIADSGLTFEPGAREELVALLGADRLSTRAELDKLALYAQGNGGQNNPHKVTVEDVRAVIADASALALDDVMDSAATGDAEAALTALNKAYAAGTQPAAILNAAIRHVTQLHRLKLAIDAGDSPARVVEYARPPVFFRRRPHFERALNRYGSELLAREIVALSDASLAARKDAALAATITERAILRLAKSGKQAGRA
jgi:DNA polymerase-3 subunit delta